MMISLPRVRDSTRERVAREFDARGPDVCRSEILEDLEAGNPELLDMATRCARDVGDFARTMTGFCMFYRVLTVEARAALEAAEDRGPQQFALLPRVSSATRMDIVRRIDAIGAEEFTRLALAECDHSNPGLLIMWHNFAEGHIDYIRVMQGFVLLYASLSAEATRERGALH
jgi:hypothetical protein